MPDLPPILAAHLQDVTFSERSVAFLKIDTDFLLTDFGGHLENYGLDEVRLGDPILDRFYVLEGLLPITDTTYFVPSVELLEGRAADLHFHADTDGTWLLLIDVTVERDAKRRVQQKAYEMTLLEEKQAQLNRRLEATNSALLLTQRDLEKARDAMREELQRKQFELAEARTLQLALAPPAYQGMLGPDAARIDVLLEPAKEVGGDLVDYFSVGEELIVLILGDVSGKGASAALMMARTHSLFRGLADRPDAGELFRSPEKAVRIANKTLAANNASCMFITLLLAAYDVPSRRLSYVRAGHLPPLLCHQDRAVEKLSAPGGPPLGLIEEAAFSRAHVELQPGDQLLIFTDGITEATDPEEKLFSEDRVISYVADSPLRGNELLGGLVRNVREFERGLAPADDKAAILFGLDA